MALLWHELKLRRLRVRFTEEREVGVQEKQRLNTCITIARQLLLVDPLPGAVFQRRYLQMALSVGSRVDIVHALAIETGFSAMLSSGVGNIRRAEKLYQLASELSRAFPYGPNWRSWRAMSARPVGDERPGRWRGSGRRWRG